MSVTTDFKSPGRIVATRDEWERIVLAKAGPCRSCGAPGESFHHVVAKSLRGDDLPANIIPLCGDGTRGCHGALETHSPGWEEVAHAVRASLTPLELAYVRAKKGAHWLDRYLPAGGTLCPRCRKAAKPRTEPARRRKNFTVKVPDDEQENGAQVLAALIDHHRQRLTPVLGMDEGTPDYYVLVAALAEPA